MQGGLCPPIFLRLKASENAMSFQSLLDLHADIVQVGSGVRVKILTMFLKSAINPVLLDLTQVLQSQIGNRLIRPPYYTSRTYSGQSEAERSRIAGFDVTAHRK